MKGGHLSENESPDWLFSAEGEQRFTAPRVYPPHPRHRLHALGRAGGAAPAPCRLGGYSGRRQDYLQQALQQAGTLEVGHGIGPVHHFHAWW